MKPKITLADYIITAAVLLLAGALLIIPLLNAPVSGDTLLVIYDGGSYEYPLSVDGSYDIESRGYHLTVEISDREAFVLSSDCENRICVESGRIKTEGQVIICAPAHVILKILSEGEGDADGVAG